MKDKNTRVEISAELRELLNDYIEEQKAIGVKGVTQIKVMEQLCKAGLAFQKRSDLAGLNVPDSMGVKQPPRLYPSEFIPETKSELKAMQEALYEKEQRLIDKERFLLDKEQILDEKNRTTNSISNNAQKDMSRDIEVFKDKMKLENKLEKIEDGNENIRDDIRSLNRDLMKLLREIKSNTEVDIVHDRILPWLTAAGVSTTAIQNLTKDKNFKLDTVLKDFIGGFGKSPKPGTGTIPKDSINNTKKT